MSTEILISSTDQLDKAIQHISSEEDYDPEIKRELERKDSMLNQVMAQSEL
jgi:hypothetical protein